MGTVEVMMAIRIVIKGMKIIMSIIKSTGQVKRANLYTQTPAPLVRSSIP